MTKYVGKRIVPVHCGVWDQNRNYEMLSIVLNMADGDSYIARREVPAGTVLSDQNYWMLHSLYSQQIKDMADELAAAEKRIMADNDATEAAINRKTDSAVSDMTRKTENAERLTNTNKAELNARMDNMEKRLDANVTAHTTPSGDFAAEVVDTRVDEAGFTHPSSGDALRSIGRNRQMLNALEGWTWKENYIVNEYGVLLPTPNWCCAHMIPVAGRRILISGCFSRMSGKAEYNNIVCFDRDKKYLGGCFRSENSGTHYDGQAIELLDGTVFISVTTGSSIVGDAKVYLPEDCRPSQLLENYATAWQWMNGAVEIDFTATDVAVRFMTTCFLCRRVNGTKYVQNALNENDSFSGGCSTAGWWAVYYQEPGVENRDTDSDQEEENAGRTLIHAEVVGPDWGHLFTADRFVIAVLYSRHVVYAAPSNNGTIIQGIDYGNPARTANTAISYGGQLGKTIFLEYGQIEIDQAARTIRVTGRILATSNTSQYFWIEESEEPTVWPESKALEQGQMMIIGFDSRNRKLNVYDTSAFQALGTFGHYVGAWYKQKLWYPHMSPSLSVTLDGETVPAGSLFISEINDTYIEKRYQNEFGRLRAEMERRSTRTMYLASGAFAIDQTAGTMQVTGRILGVPDDVRFIWVEPQEEPVPMVFNKPVAGSSMAMRILGYDDVNKTLSLYDTDSFRALGYDGYYIAAWYQNKLWYPHMSPAVQVTMDGDTFKAGDLFDTNNADFVEKRIQNYVAEALHNGIAGDNLGDIVTPSHWDCMEERQFSMFYDCLSRYEGRENLYRVTNGKSLTRNEFCLNYTPVAADTDFSVNVIRLNAETMEAAEQKTVKVRVHHKLKTRLEKNICICGDSLVDNNHVAAEVFRLLAEDGDCTATQIGTRGPSGGKHEGRGSWKWATYLQGNDYAGSNNAFWDKEKGGLNFQKYCQDHGFSGIDYFLIALGTNDVSQGGTLYNKEADVAKFIEQAKQFVDALLNPETGYHKCRIGIGLCGPGADYSYLAGNSMGIFRKSINTLNLALIKAFDEGAYHPNVTCFAHGLRTNRRLAFPYSDAPVTGRYTETSRTLTNSIHPSQRGYQAWADGYYCQIRAWLEEDAGK